MPVNTPNVKSSKAQNRLTKHGNMPCLRHGSSGFVTCVCITRRSGTCEYYFQVSRILHYSILSKYSALGSRKYIYRYTSSRSRSSRGDEWNASACRCCPLLCPRSPSLASYVSLAAAVLRSALYHRH